MTKIIGSTASYRGEEHPTLRGYKLQIVAVLKNAARKNLDEDDYAYIKDEDELIQAGGLTSDDRIEVAPWIEKEQRYSFVTSDPRAVDLKIKGVIRVK